MHPFPALGQQLQQMQVQKHMQATPLWLVEEERDTARAESRQLQAQLGRKHREAEQLEAALQAARQSSRGGGEVAIIAHQRLQNIHRYRAPVSCTVHR